MSEQARCVLTRRLTSRLRALDPDRQLSAANDWRRTVDDLTRALKTARRNHAERERLAGLQGRARRPEMPGVTGAIFDRFYDHVLEGAHVGAGRVGREITVEDSPRIVEAYRLLEAAVLSVAADPLRLAAMPLHAVALGYWCLRGSFGESLGTSIDVVEPVGKEMPAVKIAALALVDLGHATAAVARALDIDSAVVRRIKRSAGAGYAAKS